ncbi:SDR family NAD(P)-dependent oxidoreductase [Streptomyces sp. NBC_00987]|uniref:SDR family NAD(P)-dependent oxidoreductase n=1 Tax=Streptomyces sp. NBC_00987 TaxID=2903703 RepID=UPI00386CEC55
MTRTIVVTGGGTGIGRAAARLFAEQGETVIVTGRRPGPLHELAAESDVRALVCDHTDPRALTTLLSELPDRIDVQTIIRTPGLVGR